TPMDRSRNVKLGKRCQVTALQRLRRNRYTSLFSIGFYLHTSRLNLNSNNRSKSAKPFAVLRLATLQSPRPIQSVLLPTFQLGTNDISLVISTRSNLAPSSRYAKVSVWFPAARLKLTTASPASELRTSSQCQSEPRATSFHLIQLPLSILTQNESSSTLAAITR